MPEPVPLNSSMREQLKRLRARPVEKPWTNPALRKLQAAGYVVGEPLVRPSGKASRYREWRITERGEAALVLYG